MGLHRCHACPSLDFSNQVISSNWSKQLTHKLLMGKQTKCDYKADVWHSQFTKATDDSLLHPPIQSDIEAAKSITKNEVDEGKNYTCMTHRF